jgi:hypothetical protein
MIDDDPDDVRAFALLRLGARGLDFRDRFWPAHRGRIGYIRWRDPDHYPVISLGFEPREEAIPRPEEWSDEHYDLSFDGGRFVLHADEADSYEEAVDDAQIIADAFVGLLSMTVPVVFHLGTDDFPLAALPPSEFDRGELDVPAFKRDASNWWPVRWDALHEAASFDPGNYRWALDRIDRVMRDPGFPSRGPFPALTYYRLAISQVFLLGPHDEVAWILDDRDARPTGIHDGAQAEQCFLNAYKAIEALVGRQLSRSDRRLRREIEEAGLEPDYAMELPDGEVKSRFERVKRLREVRNSRAGHGGAVTPTRTLLTHFDVFEVQWVANHAIADVLDPS